MGAFAPAATGPPVKHRFCDHAKIAVALAGVALPFAHSHQEEAERWLRILRVNGAVGNAMQAIGLPEHPFVESLNPAAAEPCRPGSFEAVVEAAAANQHAHDADLITTEDLLVGVIATYGPVFEDALVNRGTSSTELFEHPGLHQ
jgi:hypothetical protein